MNARMKLRPQVAQIPGLAARYSYVGDEQLMSGLVPHVRGAGQLTKSDLLEIGLWKSPRSQRHLQRNADELVREATRVALSAKAEQLRIGALLALAGVGWPMASVILHFCHSDPYPVLDYRALWSCGIDERKVYNFAFWWSYTEFCRTHATQQGVTMRTLDRALWQYSSENQ